MPPPCPLTFIEQYPCRLASFAPALQLLSNKARRQQIEAVREHVIEEPADLRARHV